MDIDVAELVWPGSRRQAADHLISAGWQVTQRTTEQAYAANGFELPDHEAIKAFRGAVSYIEAELG